jgi:hypothetical protein
MDLENLKDVTKERTDSFASSKSSTPTSECSVTFEGFKISEDPLKKIRSYLNKITERTFDKISEEILRINLLDSTDDSKNLDIMLPVVKTFLSNICVFERNEEAMNVYVKLFDKMKNKWSGVQGEVLMQVMMKELKNFFQNYAKSNETEIDEKKRNSCFKLCKFISLLYIEGSVDFTLMVAILNTFRKIDKFHLEVFCKIYNDCQKKLYSETIFKEKVFPTFNDFLQTSSKSTSLEPMHRFMCQNILDDTAKLK